MMRWIRIAGQMIFRTQILMMALVLMVAAWMAAAEIYEVAIQLPGHGESAAMVLMGLNVLCSWLLVFNLLAVVHDMQELRLPQHRQLLTLGLLFVFGLIFVLPCLLVWALHGSARDVVMIAMGSGAGCAGAALWRTQSRARSAPADRRSVAVMPSIPVQPPNPWRAVRVALGPPYAPTSWQRRGVQMALLCVVVVSTPMLMFYERSPSPPVVTLVLHVGEFLGFLVAISFCWAWPLSRLVAILNPQSGGPTELALLPGLGTGRQQLRRLCLVALGLPFAGLMLLLIIALVLVTLQNIQHGIYLKLTLQFLLIALLTVPMLVGQINQPQKRAARFTFLFISSQTWMFSILLWSSIWNLGAIRTALGRQLIVLAGVLLLTIVILFVGFSIYSLRKLLQRPHPFVEVAS